MITLPVVVVDEPYSIVIPPISLELHTNGNPEIQKIAITLVVYAAIMSLVPKAFHVREFSRYQYLWNRMKSSSVYVGQDTI